jgi:hypothetical protein
MNHSKLPWKTFKTALNAISVKAKGGHRVCEIINDDASTLTPLIEDNAAFIARAANCHEELLLSLKETLKAASILAEIVVRAGATKYLDEHMDVLSGFGKRANAVIAKAEGRA